MEIIYNVNEIIEELAYKNKEVYSDMKLNTYFNYWCFFEDNEQEIQELLSVSLNIVLYSKYYWCTEYKNRHYEVYGKDVGVEQQQYKIIEEITQRLEDVDWTLIQMIEECKN